ncbi:MAG: ribonuclease P protein component [Oscillospiraceae bacterium]|jgi:ribonuclease P protein component|nr:ribonuclease P protein component [Oscillospiraceae bacterium]
MNDYTTMKENREFRRAYSHGKYFVSPVLVSYVIKNRKKSMVGITTSKRTGNAVRRNRSRRVIREAFRSIENNVKPGYSLVFVARGKTSFLKCGDLRRVMLEQLKSAGVCK